MKATSLFYSDIATGGTSDKEYHIQVEKKDPGYVVNYQFGRRGGTLQNRTFTPEPVSLKEADALYESKVRRQLNEGYQGAESTTAPPAGRFDSAGIALNGTHTRYPCELLEEVEAGEAERMLKDNGYWLQLKHDGERRQFERRENGNVVSYNKKNQQVPFPASLLPSFQNQMWHSFVIDAELVGDAVFVYDVFEIDGHVVAGAKYADRYENLVYLRACDNLHISEVFRTTKTKQAALAAFKKRRAEGVVFKNINAQYRAGRNGSHKKFKFTKMCTAKVIALGHKGHNSATLAAQRDGKWVEIGRASLIGKDKRIEIGAYVEVEFLNMTAGCRLYQPRILRYRTDADASDCSWSQFKYAFKEGVVAG